MIERYIVRAQNVDQAQATNIYYCYLYLRTVCPQINEHRNRIHNLVSGFKLQTHSSKTQVEVYEAMLRIGVPCIPEYNLNNLICDIMVPEWGRLKNVIIELHGYRHFCRNVKRETGSSALKGKIIAAEMYGYYYISIDEWFMAEDR